MSLKNIFVVLIKLHLLMMMKKSTEICPDPQDIADAAGTRPGSVLKSMNYSNLDAEKVLTNFGTFGPYQVSSLAEFRESLARPLPRAFSKASKEMSVILNLFEIYFSDVRLCHGKSGIFLICM